MNILDIFSENLHFIYIFYQIQYQALQDLNIECTRFQDFHASDFHQNDIYY